VIARPPAARSSPIARRSERPEVRSKPASNTGATIFC